MVLGRGVEFWEVGMQRSDAVVNEAQRWVVDCVG